MNNFMNNISISKIDVLSEQQECNHPTLFFGSGDYYVMCRECSRTWVKVSLEADEANPDFINDTITGEERYELTLDRIKAVVEKG